MATGRDKIVRLGYHGWHDWSCTRDAGIPTLVRDLTLTFTGELRRIDGIGHIWRIGRRLMEGLDRLASAYRVQAKTVSLPLTPYLQRLVVRPHP